MSGLGRIAFVHKKYADGERWYTDLVARFGNTHFAAEAMYWRGGKGRERVISFAEEAQYLAAASRTVRDAAIMASDTGLRPNSELFPLECSNVQLQSTPDAPQGFIHVTQGKTDAATRNLPVTPRTREMLIARQQLVKGSKYVFPGPGKSGHLTTIQHAHEKAVRNSGLQPFEFYCWRHTFGTRCAESGMDKLRSLA